MCSHIGARRVFVEAEMSSREVVMLGLQDSSAQVALLGSVVGDVHVAV